MIEELERLNSLTIYMKNNPCRNCYEELFDDLMQGYYICFDFMRFNIVEKLYIREVGYLKGSGRNIIFKERLEGLK